LNILGPRTRILVGEARHRTNISRFNIAFTSNFAGVTVIPVPSPSSDTITWWRIWYSLVAGIPSFDRTASFFICTGSTRTVPSEWRLLYRDGSVMKTFAGEQVLRFHGDCTSGRNGTSFVIKSGSREDRCSTLSSTSSWLAWLNPCGDRATLIRGW
jgi:hypothetical protein